MAETSKVAQVERFRWAIEFIAALFAVWLVAQNTVFENRISFVLGASLFLLCVISAAFELVLYLSKHEKGPEKPLALSANARQNGLEAVHLLSLEFEYARITCSEAIRDQRSVISFYLTLAGAILSLVLAGFGVGSSGTASGLQVLEASIQPFAGAGLLWALCLIGMFYLLQLIRLRQAWHSSASAMSRIKEFYMERVAVFSPQEFSTAFAWRQATLPPAEKRWTISFFSAALIALVSSVVYVGGGVLLALGRRLPSHEWLALMLGLGCLGGLLFFLTLYMYRLFLCSKA